MPGTVAILNGGGPPCIPVMSGLFDGKDDDLIVVRVDNVDAGTVAAHGHAVPVAVELERLGHLMRVDVDDGARRPVTRSRQPLAR